LTGILHNLVPAAHGYARIAGRVKSGDGVVHPAVVVVLFLITGHDGEVVGVGQREHVVGVEVDSLVAGTSVGAGELSVSYDAHLRTCHLGQCFVVLFIDVRGLVECFIFQVGLFVGIVEEDKPVLQWPQFNSCCNGEAVALRIGIGSALQVGNQGKLREVSVGVDWRYGRAETCQTVVEAFAQTASQSALCIIERSIGVGMREFGVEFHLQPFGQFGGDVRVQGIARIVYVCITQDTVFVVVTG